MEVRKENLFFCQNIRTLRKENQLSLAQMAQQLKIDPSILQLLEQDILPDKLDCDFLVRFSAQYSISLSDLFRPLDIG